MKFLRMKIAKAFNLLPRPGTPGVLSPLDENRRDIIRVYLGLRALFLVVSLIVISVAPDKLTQFPAADSHRRLWEAWILFAGWSIPLGIAGFRHFRRNDLLLTDWLISLSLFPDSFAIFLAASATGGATGATYRSVYFLIAIHSYHFSPKKRWAAQSGTPQGSLLHLSIGAIVTVFFGMSIFCEVTQPDTPLVQYGVEFGLQFLIATAFILVRLSNLKRVQMLEQAQQELERARETERRLLDAMQDVSRIARISDEGQLDKKLRKLVREISQDLGSEYCVLALVRENRLQVVARHASFKVTKAGKSALQELTTRPLGAGLVGSVLRSRSSFRWNSKDERDFADLGEDGLTALGISRDIAGTLRLRDEVLPSRSVRNILVAPFYSQDSEERPLGYVLLLNKVAGKMSSGKEFSDRDEGRLHTIVTQLAVAITNFEHHLRDVARAERERFFNSLILTEDLDDLFNRVLVHLNLEYSSRVASLWLATEDGFDETPHVVLRSVIVAEQIGMPSSKRELEEHLKQLKIFRLDECFIGRFFRDNESPPQVTYIDDLRTVTDSWAPCLQQLGTPHLIAIPIWRYHAVRSVAEPTVSPFANNLLAGVVCLRPVHSFLLTPERREDFERLAAYLAVLIDQVRFRRRYRQIEILKNHLPELQTADLEDFYARVVLLVRDALESEVCSLFTLDPEGALILKATTAERAIRIDYGGQLIELLTADYIGKVVYPAGEQSNTSKIAEVRKTTLLYDVHRSAYMSTLFMEVTQTPDHQSLIGAPIVLTDGTLLGVLRCINRRKAGALLPVFVQEDKEFLDLVVGIMARFIENAEASASKRNFLTQLAHELATPLAALGNQIDFLEDVILRGRYVRDSEEQFAYLREQAGFIQYLVNDIQYQFGKGEIRTRYEFSKAVDLTRMIERIKKLLIPTARMDKQIDIITGTSSMPPLYVDPRRMEQVIFNLLQNAVKYSRIGGKHVFLGYDLVVEQDSQGHPISWHRIKFENWGVGVKESDLPFIFEEYRRGSNVEGAPSGTGLGLAVAKRIVEAHGGRISVVRLRNPTEFAVDLPEDLSRRPPSNANPSN